MMVPGTPSRSACGPLREELAMPQSASERAYPEAKDLQRAQSGDLQGIGR